MIGIVLGTGEVKSAKANGMDFDVQPSEQNYANLGYFKLKALPGNDTKLSVRITNLTGNNITVDVNKLNALTSPYGNIQYVPNKELPNSKLLNDKFLMSKYLSGESTINLKGNESKIVTYSLRVPRGIDKGTLLGGLSFKKHGNVTAKPKNGKAVINNQVERVIGVEADYSNVKSSLSLSKPFVKTSPSTPFLNFPLKNDKPSIASSILMSYEVFDGGRSLYKGKTDEFKMAPMSEINYVTNWGAKEFKPGLYTVKVLLKSNGQVLENKTYKVKVSQYDIDKYKKQLNYKPSSKPVPVDGSSLPWVIMIGVSLLGVVVGACIMVLITRVRNKNKDNK